MPSRQKKTQDMGYEYHCIIVVVIIYIGAYITRLSTYIYILNLSMLA